jgi:uncharacterized membrane protein
MTARLVSGLVCLAVLASGWAVTATLRWSIGSQFLLWLTQLGILVVSLWFATVAHRQVLRRLAPAGWRRRQERERQESARRAG